MESVVQKSKLPSVAKMETAIPRKEGREIREIKKREKSDHKLQREISVCVSIRFYFPRNFGVPVDS